MKYDHEIDYFSKFKDEKFDKIYSFTDDLESGATLSTCTATVFDSSNSDVTSDLIASTTVTATNITIGFQGGIEGETYQAKLAGVSSGSHVYIHYVTLEVFGSITLNTKLGDINSNSYVTLKEANDYIRNKYGHDSNWDTLSTEGKKRILIEATKDLGNFNFIKGKYYSGQALPFPMSDHAVITGNCGTPLTTNSFRHTSLYSSSYGKYPTNYWKYGTVHITSATPLRDTRNISLSNVANGSVTVSSNLSATPTTNTQFTIFEPLYQQVKDAQCEHGLFLVDNAGSDDLYTYKEVADEVQIGDVRVRFKSGNTQSGKMPISPKAKNLLTEWIKRMLVIGRR